MERNYKVYMHTSPSNKVYIGITKQKPEYRWRKGKKYTENKHFTRAIEKYGWDNFTHEILFDNLTKEEAKLMEKFYIAIYDSTNQNKGYNITLGGDGGNGHQVTEEQKTKISQALSGRKGISRYGEDNPMYGKHHNNETKKKISKANKGKIISEETKKKMSENTKGNKRNSKSVICITTKKIFFTAKEAGKYYGLKDGSDIVKVCKGKSKSAGKLNGTKLVWRYLIWNHDKTYRIINKQEVA